MKFLIAVGLLICGFVLAPASPVSAPQQVTNPSVRGRVLYPNGKVAPGAVVLAFKKDQMTGRILTGNSDNQGRFIFPALERGVEYSLCASKQADGYLNPYMLPFGLSTGGQCKKVVAGAVFEVDLTLAPKSGSLEGQVRDAKSGNPIQNGKAIVYRPLKLLGGQWTLANPREATWVPTAEGTLDDSGHFRISGLPRGTYFLKVEIQGRSPWYFKNQLSDIAAQPLLIQGGLTTKVVVSM